MFVKTTGYIWVFVEWRLKQTRNTTKSFQKQRDKTEGKLKRQGSVSIRGGSKE